LQQPHFAASLRVHNGVIALHGNERGFHKLYRLPNGMPLKEMDKITDPVSVLCRDQTKAGVVHGVLVGIRLAQERR